MVAIIDYGVGNVMAIQNIIRKVGGNSIMTSAQQEIEKADRIILPGVGSFGFCITQLQTRNLVAFLEEQVFVKKKIILGLCVGAQLMTRESEEGNLVGLGWVNAKTKRFDEKLVPTIPHMGWTDVKFKESALTRDFEHDPRFYFAHSYHFVFEEQTEILGTSHFGCEFTCAFHHENIFGVQFHPEKSHKYGMRLFENFLKA